MLSPEKMYRLGIAFGTIFFAWYGGFITSQAAGNGGSYVVTIAGLRFTTFWPMLVFAAVLTVLGAVGVRRLMKIKC